MKPKICDQLSTWPLLLPNKDYIESRIFFRFRQNRFQYVLFDYRYDQRVSGFIFCEDQRWSPRGRPWPRGRPRGQILKTLALASKVKSLALASRPQVLENWPVLGSRTALFFGKLKFCGAVEKFFNFLESVFSWRSLEKFLWRPFFFFFFGEHLRFVSLVLGLGLEHSCPWPRECLSSERLSLALALASSLVSSTPPLVKMPQKALS